MLKPVPPTGVTVLGSRLVTARQVLAVAAGLGLTLSLVGCAGGDKPAANPASSSKARNTSPAASPTSSECLGVSRVLLRQIASRVEAGVVGPLRLTSGKAVRSKDFAKVYFVAANMTAPGLSDVGVWATNDLAAPGTILAVDGFAQQFTDWTDADKSGAHISAGDPSVDRAKDCL